MTFREMNDMFFVNGQMKKLCVGQAGDAYIQNEPVSQRSNGIVDEALLVKELERCGLPLPGLTT